jgi:hypothetical protein
VRVNWADATIPGSVCGAKAAIHLLHGTAVVKDSPWPANPYVHASLDLAQYGDLNGHGPDQAALDIWCDNGGGTADGQLADAWVMFTATAEGPRVIGVLTPQEPVPGPGWHVPYFDDLPGGITIRPGQVVVREVWYGPGDGICCPQDRATTVWAFSSSGFHPDSTTVTKTALPLPTTLGVPGLRPLSGALAIGTLMAVDPATGTGDFFISCGWDFKSKKPFDDEFREVALRHGTFGVETDPLDPARGAVRSVTWQSWEPGAMKNGWSGVLYLASRKPLLTDGPGTDVCRGVS